jgi:hypothetical protein
MTSLSDQALLERALLALEEALGRAESDAHRLPSSIAKQVSTTCIMAAAALVDVAQTLATATAPRPSDELERHWQSVITHTRHAGRSAHQAAMLLSTQKHIVAAQAARRVGGEAPLSAVTVNER